MENSKSKGQAGIEVTPEMAKAGERVLIESGRIENSRSGDVLLVREIYIAMLRNRSVNTHGKIG